MAGSYNELMGIGVHSEDANAEQHLLLLDNAPSVTVLDQTSNSANGELEGGDDTEDISTATGATDFLPRKLDLDGSADRISLGSTAIGTSNYCLMGRMNADAAGSGNRCVFRLREAGVTELIGRWESDNRFRFYENRTSGGGTQDIFSSVLTEGQWYSFALNRNGNTNTLYINGSSVGTDTNSSANNLTTRTLYVGSSEGTSEFFDGKLNEITRFSRSLTSPEHAEWDGGPELNYVSGATFGSDGSFNGGTFALPAPYASGSNGTPTYSFIAVKADGTVLDSASTLTGTLDLSANAGNTCYLLGKAENDGGSDIGDFASRTSSYGSSGDGYYEIASVTAAGGGGGSVVPIIMQLMAA